jgi:transcriptional regulator with XRE-family HTH domain
MATRERPGDVGAADARRTLGTIGPELKAGRRELGMSQARASRRAGISRSLLGRVERGQLATVTVDHLARAARAVGLKAVVKLYPDETPVRDQGQLALLARFEERINPPIRLRREVALPIASDLRAWDARITDGDATASIEGEARLNDVQAVSRRVALKQRDDPQAGAVILLVSRTAHNRAVVALHRDALRAQFPMDGAAILAALRRGTVPRASGILML